MNRADTFEDKCAPLLLTSCLALAGLTSACMAQAVVGQKPQPAAHVRIGAMRVVSPALKGLLSFGSFPGEDVGTRIALLITPAQGYIVGLRESATELEFIDESEANVKLEVGEGFGSALRLAPDRKAGVVNLQSEKTPSPESCRLRLKGRLTVRLAEKKEKVTEAMVALKQGTKVEAGPLRLRIEKAGKPNWGDHALEVTFRTDQDLDQVYAMRFYDESGELIESSETGTGWQETKGNKTYSISFGLRRAVSNVKLEVTYWAGARDVQVPVDLRFGVGLSAQRGDGPP